MRVDEDLAHAHASGFLLGILKDSPERKERKGKVKVAGLCVTYCQERT